MKKNLFVDMDGVLAEWRTDVTPEEIYEKNYFLNLRPQLNVVKAVLQIAQLEDVNVYILSAVLGPEQEAEKRKWLDEWLPCIDTPHRIFVPYGASKVAAAEYYVGSLPDSINVLLDDYSKNIGEWESAGGISVKLFNGVNGKSGRYNGYHYSCAWLCPERIELDLKTALRCQ